jgi:hypothetical protein
MTTTRAQREALFEVFSRNGFRGGYRAFRRTCHWEQFSRRRDGTATILVEWAGMLLGIEPDGCVHS